MKYALAAGLALAILACWKWFLWWRTCNVLAEILADSLVDNHVDNPVDNTVDNHADGRAEEEEDD